MAIDELSDLNVKAPQEGRIHAEILCLDINIVCIDIGDMVCIDRGMTILRNIIASNTRIS